MAIVQTLNREDLEVRERLLPWQRQGLSYTRTGYGKKIPTSNVVRLPGEKRWRRVYLCVYSNLGTYYLDTKAGWIVIR